MPVEVASLLMRFGEKLKILRTGKELTLSQLAEQLGLKSHSYLSELESGRKVPTSELVLRVSRLFCVTTDCLLKDEEEIAYDEEGV